MAKAHRQYSDDEKATFLAALDANGGNINKTAKQLGVPRKTLESWANGRIHPDVANLRQDKKGTLADKCNDVAWKLAGAIEGKIDKAPLNHVAVAFGVIVDKMQLLLGKPTEINEDVTKLADDDLRRRIEASERRRIEISQRRNEILNRMAQTPSSN